MISDPNPQPNDVVIIQRDFTNSFYGEVHISGSNRIIYIDNSGLVNADDSASFYALFPPVGVGSGGSGGSSVSSSWASSSISTSYSPYALTSSYAFTASVQTSWEMSSSYASSSTWAESASFSDKSISASYAPQTIQTTVASASWVSASVKVTTADTASYISSSNVVGTVMSASFAQSSSWAPSIIVTSVPSASWASQSLSASYAPSSGGGGTSLTTGSTYPITASWANYSLTASAFSSITGSNLLYLYCDDGNTYPVTLTNYSGSVIFSIGQTPVSGTNNFLSVITSISSASYASSASNALTAISASYAPFTSSAVIYTASNSSTRLALSSIATVGNLCFQTDNHQAYMYVSCSLTSSNPWKHMGGYPITQTEDKFGGISTSSLVLWLRAEDLTASYTDGQKVGTWIDKSVTASPATQGNATYQPTFRLKGGANGYPRAEFYSNAGSYMSLPQVRTCGTNCSLFVVFRSAMTNNGTAQTFFCNSGANTQYLTLVPSSNNMFIYVGGPGAQYSPYLLRNFDIYTLMWITFISGVPYFGQNDRSLGNTSGGYPSLDIDTFGTLVTGGPQPIWGDVLEVAVFNTAQTGSNLTAIQNYFMYKYNL
jgi:hypothetical protein